MIKIDGLYYNDPNGILTQEMVTSIESGDYTLLKCNAPETKYYNNEYLGLEWIQRVSDSIGFAIVPTDYVDTWIGYWDVMEAD